MILIPGRRPRPRPRVCCVCFCCVTDVPASATAVFCTSSSLPSSSSTCSSPPVSCMNVRTSESSDFRSSDLFKNITYLQSSTSPPPLLSFPLAYGDLLNFLLVGGSVLARGRGPVEKLGKIEFKVYYKYHCLYNSVILILFRQFS